MGSFNLEQFQTVKGSKNVMVIATDSFYRKIFSRYQSDSIPVIDFRIYDLVLFSACGYCMDGCQHDKGITSCHRNACDYQRAWFVHEKSLGRVGEQVIMK